MKQLRTKIASVITLLGFMGLAAFFVMSENSREQKHPWQSNDYQPFTQWYQINWYQQSVGYASTSLMLSDDEKHWIVTEDEYFEGRVQKRFVSFHYTTELIFERQPPYSLQSGTITTNEPELSTRKTFVQNDENLLVRIQRNQQDKNYELTPLEFSLNDYFALENTVLSLIQSSSNNQKVVSINSLDQDIFEPLTHEWRIEQTPKLASFQWHAENSGERYSPFQSIVFNDDGSIHSKSRTNGMQFIPSTGKITLNTAMQPDLYQFNGIKLTNSYLLENLSSIDKLKLSSSSSHQLNVSNFELPPNVTLQGNELIMEAYEPYLANAASLESLQVDPVNQRTARLLDKLMTGLDALSPLEKSTSLLRRTHEYLHYQTSPAGFNLEEILTEKRGDCTEYSQLYAALLNHAGIPSRIRSGYVYLGEEEQSFGGHVWVEALIEGRWHGFDPTWNLDQLTLLHLPISVNNSANSLQPAEFTIKSIND